MSMSGQPTKSPPCSSHTPTQDLNEVDTETAHGTNEEQGGYPRFLVVDGKDRERPLSGIHPVIVDRTIRGCTSASVHVERMGKAYLVKVHCKTYADSLLSLGMVQDCPVQVTPHRSLNSSRGVVQFGRSAKGLSTEDIIEEISTSPRNEEVPEITSANRATIQKNGSKIPTGTFFLTFNSECLPTYLFLGFERFKVERYLPTPHRCFKCQKFGHGSKTCRSKEDICSICASTDHSYKDCTNQDSPHCRNCSGPHQASDQECPKYLVEKTTLKLQEEKRLSPKEARTEAEAQHRSTPGQGRTWANVAAVEQAALLERNFQLGDEKRQLQNTINELRIMNTALIGQIQALEKRIHSLESSVGQSHTPSTMGGTHKPHSPAAATAKENSPAAGQFHGPHATGTAHPHISAGCSSRPTSTDNDVEGTPFPGGRPASPAPVEDANSSSPPQEETSVTQDETPQFSGEAPSRAGGAKNTNPQKATEAPRREEVVSQHVAVTSEAPGPARPLRNSPRKTPFRGFQDNERKEKPHASMPSLGPDLAPNYIPLQSPTPRIKILNRGGLGKNNSSAKSKPNSTISPATKQARDRPQRSAQANKSGH